MNWTRYKYFPIDKSFISEKFNMPPKSRAIRGRGHKGRGRGRGVPSVSVIESEVEKIDGPIIQESQQALFVFWQ